jgi:hypothetical protein
LLSNSAFSPQLIVRNSTVDAFGPYWNTGKSRAGGIVVSGDDLGTFMFQGHDGNTFVNSAWLVSEVEGSPTANSGFVPSKLSFLVSNNTATSTKLTINSTATSIAGVLATGNTTITGFANVSSTLAAGNTTITGFANVTTTLQVGTNTATFGTAAYIVANGNVGIGNSTPTAPLCVNGNTILGNTTTTGTLVVYNTNADANVAGGVTVDVNGPVLRVGDRNIARTFANGVGIKIHDSGAVHYSVGQIGNAFVIADTSSDADSLYPASRTNILSANSTLATIGVPFNVSSTYTTFGSTGQTTLSLTTSATTANQVVATAVVLGAAVWRSVKYQVQVTSGSAYQFTEISIVHDGTTVYKSEYGTVLSGALLATFDADISGGNIRLLTTPVNAVTVYKGLATMVAV